MIKKPNLFVLNTDPGFEELTARHNATGGNESYFEERVCTDLVKRMGIWVPLGWWGEGGRPSKTWQKPVPKIEPETYPTDEEMMAL